VQYLLSLEDQYGKFNFAPWDKYDRCLVSNASSWTSAKTVKLLWSTQEKDGRYKCSYTECWIAFGCSCSRKKYDIMEFWKYLFPEFCWKDHGISYHLETYIKKKK
jgi:hypothetical protein